MLEKRSRRKREKKGLYTLTLHLGWINRPANAGLLKTEEIKKD